MNNIATDHRNLTGEVMRNEIDSNNAKHRQILSEKEKYIKELKNKNSALSSTNNVLSATVNQQKDQLLMLAEGTNNPSAELEKIALLNGKILIHEEENEALKKKIFIGIQQPGLLTKSRLPLWC